MLDAEQEVTQFAFRSFDEPYQFIKGDEHEQEEPNRDQPEIGLRKNVHGGKAKGQDKKDPQKYL